MVPADWLFAAPAVVVQLLSGGWLMWRAGYPLTTGWILAALGLYVLVGDCWLPVVWLQLRMRQSVLGMFCLMLFKPQW